MAAGRRPPQQFPIKRRAAGARGQARSQKNLQGLIGGGSRLKDIDEKSQLGSPRGHVVNDVPVENPDTSTRVGNFKLHKIHVDPRRTQSVNQ